MKHLIFSILIGASTLLWLSSSWAYGRGGSGGWSLGASAGIVNTDQDDMNTLITRANTREGGISTSQFGNAWELNGYISYGFSGSSLSWQIRPSYLFQSQTGTGTSGDFNYDLNAITVFPILRWNMLEDQTIKFFSQFGVGWAFVSGSIEEGDGGQVDFSGSNMGYMAGLGAEFCFFSGSHCFTIEGNLRFLSVNRLLADKHSGGSFASDSLSQPDGSGTGPKELELDDKDIGTSLSGIQGLLGYAFHF